MEERRVGPLLVACLVLGLLVARSTPAAAATSFKDCYKVCFILCVITPGSGSSFSDIIFQCATQCLKNCILPPASLSDSNRNANQTLYFCELGCASTLCTHFSSKNNPAEEKVATCVNSCSGRCTKSCSS